MGMPARMQGPSQAESLDDPFMAIMSDFIDIIIGDAGQAASRILELSSQFLSSSAKVALQNFHDLYFGGEKMNLNKEAVNREVDDIFDQVLTQVAAGHEVASCDITVHEDASTKQSRLMLSGLQKQLETIISLDSGIREKLVPVLTTMQFEDMIKQRLTHIRNGWQAVHKATVEGVKEFDDMAQELGTSLSSNLERKLYYSVVLGTEPPPGSENDGMVFEF